MRFLLQHLTCVVMTAAISCALTAYAADYQAYPVIDYTKVSDPELVKKGEYLAKTGDCIACHTDKAHGGQAFAGGLGIETPFGAFYSPNITADEATGIGAWTDQQFLAAVREGNGPHGNYFPVFPFLYFNKMTNTDVLAIKAYLFAVPKIHSAPKENQVPWPFDVRLAQYGWKMLFFYPYRGVYQENPHQSAEWNRGAYLVEGPGHCGMCHSPLNLLGAEKRRYRYTGGFVQGFYAPDITSVGLSKYSVNQIVGVLSHGKTLSGSGHLSGPMLEAYNDSFQYLTHDDARAIAVYLKTVVRKEPPKSSGVVTASTGPKIYNKYCASCHMNGGNGAPIFGDVADWRNRVKPGIDVVVMHAVQGIGSMPAMGNCAACSQAEIRATVQYMIDNSTKTQVDHKPKLQDYFYKLPKVTPEQGKAIYEKHCAVCHDQAAHQIPAAPKMSDYALWSEIFTTQNFDDVLDTVIYGKNLKNNIPHPLHGGCAKCSTPDIIAATKYLAQQNANGNYDFSLW